MHSKLTFLPFPKYQNSPFKVAPQPFITVAPSPNSKARSSLIFPSKSTIIGCAELAVLNIRTAVDVGDVVVSGCDGVVTSGDVVVSVQASLSHGHPPMQFS